MSDGTLLELLTHSEWADAALWTSVLSSSDSRTDSQVLTWMHHIHSVQRAFESLWRGNEVDFCQVEDFGDAMAIVEWGREGHGGMQGCVSSTTTSELDRVLPIPWGHYFEERWGRPMASVLVRESILQVAMHSVHHRGQVASRLRQLEVEPSLIDYIAWLWFDRPSAGWPQGAE